MAWKSTGRPTVRQQRDKWVVRVDGIDTETGKRPSTPARHLPVAARRPTALAELLERGDAESAVRATRDGRPSSSTHGRRPRSTCRPRAASSTSGPPATSARASAAIPLDQLTARTSPRWIDDMAAGGMYARRSSRSSGWCCGRRWTKPSPRAGLRRSAGGAGRHAPGGRQGRPGAGGRRRGPRTTSAQFLAAVKDHRWYGPIRLDVLYGLRRTELLGLKWGDVDLKAGTVRIERA